MIKTGFVQKLLHRLFTFSTPRSYEENNDPMFYSQYGQDKYLIKTLFKESRDGIFVDVGANDGISFSNTYALETNYNWTGLCVEPMPDKYTDLKKHRKSKAINGCISSKDGETEFFWVKGRSNMLSVICSNCTTAHRERIEREVINNKGEIESIKVKTYTLTRLLEKNNISHVDFLSIDIEGAELDALTSIDFNKFDISVIAVENNEKNWRIPLFLYKHGYKILSIKGDEIYSNKSISS